MSKKDPKVTLKQILRDIKLIEEYVKEVDKDVFLNSFEKRDATSKRLENIGEAVKRLPS